MSLRSNLKVVMLVFSTVLLLGLSVFAADDVVSAVHGTVDKLDTATKTVVVKTSDGAVHSLRFAGNTAVHGAHVGEEATKESFDGLKEGDEVVAHYTEEGGKATAIEVDRVGKDGLNATEGTISAFDRAGKTITIKSADGTEHAFVLTGRASKDAGKDIGEGTEKGTKVVVYSAAGAGKDVAHFFEKL